MATPVSKIATCLKNNVDKLDPQIKKEHIYGMMISPNERTTTEPIILVTEMSGGHHTYGNNAPILTKGKIQITIYYPKNYREDMESLELSLKAFLLSKKITCYSDAGHVLTPDNQQITNTLKFNFIKEDI